MNRILRLLKHPTPFSDKWFWQSISWERARREILRELKVKVASIPTQNYKEVIEIRVPTRFYWDETGFDGIEFGEFLTKLQPWEDDMVRRCLEAIMPTICEDYETKDTP